MRAIRQEDAVEHIMIALEKILDDPPQNDYQRGFARAILTLAEIYDLADEPAYQQVKFLLDVLKHMSAFPEISKELH